MTAPHKRQPGQAPHRGPHHSAPSPAQKSVAPAQPSRPEAQRITFRRGGPQTGHHRRRSSGMGGVIAVFLTLVGVGGAALLGFANSDDAEDFTIPSISIPAFTAPKITLPNLTTPGGPTATPKPSRVATKAFVSQVAADVPAPKAVKVPSLAFLTLQQADVYEITTWGATHPGQARLVARLKSGRLIDTIVKGRPGTKIKIGRSQIELTII
jgi:hypothetical protein